jgi:thiamine-phosphate pyrophosphorylase
VSLPRLYAVLDADVAAAHGWQVLDLARAFLAGGATLIQWRAKHLDPASQLSLANSLVALAAAAGARIVVNDRADVARLARAAGVHVGQEDLGPRDARAVVGPSAMIGLSTHTPGQIASAAAEPIDYLAVGPIFGTKTKHTGYDAAGLGLVRHARSRTTAPVVAIGGITLDTAGDVLDAGATSVAVISDLVATGDPTRRVRDYLERLGFR